MSADKPLGAGQIAGARLSMGEGTLPMVVTKEFFRQLLDAAESLAARDAEIAELRARAERAEADAGRYRWLRSQMPDAPKWKTVACPTCEALAGEPCGRWDWHAAAQSWSLAHTDPHAPRVKLVAQGEGRALAAKET